MRPLRLVIAQHARRCRPRLLYLLADLEWQWSLRRRLRHLERIRFLRLRAVRHPRMMMRGTEHGLGEDVIEECRAAEDLGIREVPGIREDLEFRETPGFRDIPIKREPLSRRGSVEPTRDRDSAAPVDRPPPAARESKPTPVPKERKAATHKHHRRSAGDGGGGSDDDRKSRHRKHGSRPSRDAKPRRKDAAAPGPGPGAPGAPDGGPGRPGDDDPGPSGSEGSYSSSGSESESDSDDEEEKLHKAEIDAKRKGVFVMTSERLRKAKKNKSRNNMRCEVEKFTRESEINVIEWIVQMETYFGISSLKPRDYVGFMLQKIAQPYFKEMSPFKDLAYFDFREKLIEVFGEPDMATARIHELRRAEQQYGEPISEYMNRLRLLVMRAHPELSHKERERILVPSFILGLRDHELSTSLTMASVTSSAEAERRATEGESARRNARSKRSYANYLPEPSEVPNETAGVPETCEEPSEEACAAFGVQRGNRGGRFFRGRGRTGPARGGSGRGKCYNCGEMGHFRAECPHPQDPSTFPQPRQGQFQCSICRGPHLTRYCPRYSEPSRDLGNYGSTSGPPQRVPGDARVSTSVPVRPSTTASQPQSGPSHATAARPQNTQSSTTSFFSEDSPAMPIMESLQPAESCGKAWLAAMGSSPGNARTALSFFAGNIQNQTYWILVDSGSVRNLIDDRVFDSLPYQPPLRQRDVQIFGGNGGALSIRGFAVLPVVICGAVLWHEFAVVHELPLRAIIGADILQPHLASLSYLNGQQKKLELGTGECATCSENKMHTDEGFTAQMRYVERHIRDLRIRYQIEDGFMAVLPLKEAPLGAQLVSKAGAVPPLGARQDSRWVHTEPSSGHQSNQNETRRNRVETVEPIRNLDAEGPQRVPTEGPQRSLQRVRRYLQKIKSAMISRYRKARFKPYCQNLRCRSFRFTKSCESKSSTWCATASTPLQQPQTISGEQRLRCTR